jgi:hypothetical protein
MTDRSKIDDQLHNPKDVRGADGTRSDGRPTDPKHALEDQPPAEHAPTEAPEDRGHRPTTEHAPGGDL